MPWREKIGFEPVPPYPMAAGAHGDSLAVRLRPRIALCSATRGCTLGPMETRLGILLWNQATDWPAYEAAARRIDELGYDHLWAWDHLYAIFGDPYQPLFEGYATLAAWAKVTKRARLGLLVGANPFRNPGLVAKTAITLDHISDGRAILGIGGAWFEKETRVRIEFGEASHRLTGSTSRSRLRGLIAASRQGHHCLEVSVQHRSFGTESAAPVMIVLWRRKTLRTVAATPTC